eukprot:scaffold11866_cov117-Isochrysis_galbana.AAC.3
MGVARIGVREMGWAIPPPSGGGNGDPFILPLGETTPTGANAGVASTCDTGRGGRRWRYRPRGRVWRYRSGSLHR